MSIALNILDIVNDILKKDERRNLKEIVVDIGESVAVVPDSLQFCYETIVKDTEYKNAELKINIIPLKIMCHNCKKKSNIERYSFICPRCDSSNITVLSGEELQIRYLEVD